MNDSASVQELIFGETAGGAGLNDDLDADFGKDTDLVRCDGAATLPLVLAFAENGDSSRLRFFHLRLFGLNLLLINISFLRGFGVLGFVDR